MRGTDERSGALFSYVDLEARMPASHPLRTIRVIVNEALAALSPSFHDLYARVGRPSIPPEQLLRALLLQAFYSIRSEPQLMERLDFDLLFRWFVGLGIDDQVWNHSTFFCHRALCAKGLLNTGEVLASVRDPQHLCHVHLMRSASAEEAHLEDGVLVAPKYPAACPLPSSSPGSSLSGKGLQAEPRSCRLRLEIGAVDPHAVQDHRKPARERNLGAFGAAARRPRIAQAFNGNQRATRVIITRCRSRLTRRSAPTSARMRTTSWSSTE